MRPLTLYELDVRHRLESVIENGLATFEATGRALLEIRDCKLYRDDYRTFEAYCRKRWGFSKSRGNQLIAGVKVLDNLTTTGCQLNERQLRELGKEEPAVQIEVAAQIGAMPPAAATLREMLDQRREQIASAEKAANDARPAFERPARDRLKAIEAKLRGALKLVDGSIDFADRLEQAIRDALEVLASCQVVQALAA
jgi:hypothetical protein